mmetsp:Transcript_1342/g.1612  ORF Transcript_1342/g.1612 Transcript_1342/m.1612 type:complete len:221 (+) Transcript_1342:772-1434(+)
MESKRCLFLSGSIIASLSSPNCFSKPPIIPKLSFSLLSPSFISTSIALTLESYSEGSFSKMRYESLFVPTKSPGISSSAGTRPITGRNIVCRVLVLITTLFVILESSTSFALPSSFSSSFSKSKSSTTFPTRNGSCLFSFTFSRFSLMSFFFFSCSSWRRVVNARSIPVSFFKARASPITSEGLTAAFSLISSSISSSTLLSSNISSSSFSSSAAIIIKK